MTTTPLPEIHREHFEAWLMAQADDRVFDYTDSTGCLCCMFFREMTSLQTPIVGPARYRDLENIGIERPLPRWVLQVLEDGRMFAPNISGRYTFRYIKQAYQKLFPATPAQAGTVATATAVTKETVA